MLRGVNDSAVHAEQLADLLAPWGWRDRMVNLIPYNTTGLAPSPSAPPFQPPADAEVRAFAQVLQRRGPIARVHDEVWAGARCVHV